MYNSPHRPYYNYRSEDMPQDGSQRDVNTIESRRFWQLFKNLRRRQQQAKAENEQKPASSGS